MGIRAAGLTDLQCPQIGTRQFWALLQMDYAVDVSTLREALTLDKTILIYK